MLACLGFPPDRKPMLAYYLVHPAPMDGVSWQTAHATERSKAHRFLTSFNSSLPHQRFGPVRGIRHAFAFEGRRKKEPSGSLVDITQYRNIFSQESRCCSYWPRKIVKIENITDVLRKARTGRWCCLSPPRSRHLARTRHEYRVESTLTSLTPSIKAGRLFLKKKASTNRADESHAKIAAVAIGILIGLPTRKIIKKAFSRACVRSEVPVGQVA
eukprot:GHVU01071230.1.p1 GENE.GHVU01071230.1~~GHVU01071230.1.p1  ORF type:complete len:214 (-),score=3.11 GHVU01071230.1:424-1065(-)